MSGHSKWANIKRTKAKVDAERGKAFSRVAKDIIAAARHGGGNPEANIRLKNAVLKAREVNMPADTIKRAIDKGTGNLPGVRYEEAVYEGYGPAGVAVLLEIMTDNRNRTAGEIRHIFSKHGGNLGESGSVGWMFAKKGVITIDRETNGIGEDDLMLVVLDAGADDMVTSPETFEVITSAEALDGVLEALEKAGVTTESGEVRMVPSTTVEVRGDDARKLLKLVDLLEEHDDVQNVWVNFDIPEDELANLEE